MKHRSPLLWLALVATMTFFVQRGSRLTAVGKTSGANFGSFVVGDGPQEWYLH